VMFHEIWLHPVGTAEKSKEASGKTEDEHDSEGEENLNEDRIENGEIYCLPENGHGDEGALGNESEKEDSERKIHDSVIPIDKTKLLIEFVNAAENVGDDHAFIMVRNLDFSENLAFSASSSKTCAKVSTKNEFYEKMKGFEEISLNTIKYLLRRNAFLSFVQLDLPNSEEKEAFKEKAALLRSKLQEAKTEKEKFRHEVEFLRQYVQVCSWFVFLQSDF